MAKPLLLKPVRHQPRTGDRHIEGKGVDPGHATGPNGTWSHYLFAKYHVSAHHRLKDHRDSLTFERGSPHPER